MGLNLSKMNKLHVPLKYARLIPEPCVHDSQTIGQLEKHFHLDQLCFVEMPRLSEQQRNQAIGMLRAGFGYLHVAPQLNCDHSTIFCLLIRYQLSGTRNNGPRPGQPRVTTPRQDIFIRQWYLRGGLWTSSSNARILLGRHG